MKHSDVTPLFAKMQQAKIKVLADQEMPQTVVLNAADLAWLEEHVPNGVLVGQKGLVVIGMYAEAGSVGEGSFAILNVRGETVYLDGEDG